MSINRELKDRVKENLNIAQIIGEYVPSLKKSGKNWIGLCPFHNDRNPSFSVSEDYNIYKCFSCGETGDLIRFIEKIEGLSFTEAVVFLAKRAGIDPGEVSGTGGSSGKNDLIAFNAKMVNFFRHFLIERPEGSGARNYLLKRGISPDVSEVFQLGYAPADFALLREFLVKKGFTQEFLLSSGLFVKNDRYGMRPLFYDRVMFPIVNHRGEVTGFGGRALNDDIKPKYLNTPETALYKKSFNLYGINTAKDVIRTEGRAFLVEGYVDVIGSYMNGLKCAVAPCGTAVTKDQLKLLSRFTQNIILLLDGDEAGLKGAMRALKEGVNLEGTKLSVLVLPDGMDPDDFFKDNDIQKFKEFEKNRMDAFDFCIFYKTRGRDLKDYNTLLEVVVFLFDYVIEWDNEIVRKSLIEKIAQNLNVKTELISEEFYKYKVKREGRHSDKSKEIEAATTENVNKPEERYRLTGEEKKELAFLIACFDFEDDDGCRELLKRCEFKTDIITGKYSQELFEMYMKGSLNRSNLIEVINNDFVREYVNERLFKKGQITDKLIIRDSIVDMAYYFMKRYLEKQSDELTRKIRFGEMYKDTEVVKKLQEDKTVIIQKILRLSDLQELKK